MFKHLYSVPLLSVLAFTTACSSSDKDLSTTTSAVKGGDFQLMEAGSNYTEFSGYAHVEVTNRSSSVEVYVTGLTPNAVYNAHVHTGWCASGGGGHYLQKTDGEDVAANGLWPIITVDDDGIGMGSASHDFVITDEAKSVVIHETGASDRIACVDLYSSAAIKGSFAITEAGAALYESIEGQAFVSVRGGESKAEVGITGLTASKTYKAHVHVGDCASGGGGHYLQDLEGEDVIANGLWPGANVDEFGYASGWTSNAFKVRVDETKSIVVHDTDDSTIRVACADLDTDLLAFRSGSFWMTVDGIAAYGEGAINGRAKLSISSAGVSSVSVYVSGLSADTEYKAHVHSADCESGGGPHYWQDMVSKADVAANGLFPVLNTDAVGTAMTVVSNDFIVRPDARSVVIHESGASTRIACADLR